MKSSCGCDSAAASNSTSAMTSSSITKSSNKVVEIKDENDFHVALEENRYTVIDFYADWCGPCKQIAPEIERLAQRNRDVKFLKVNSDDLSDLAQDYVDEGLPTFVFLKNGKPKRNLTVVGADLTKVKSSLKTLVY